MSASLPPLRLPRFAVTALAPPPSAGAGPLPLCEGTLPDSKMWPAV